MKTMVKILLLGALPLEPGEHTLPLILGNFFARPSKPPVVSEKITIPVK